MKLMNVARRYGSPVVRRIAPYAAAGSALVASAAFADGDTLPAGVAEGFTQVKTQGLAMADLAWPTVIGLTISLILFKLYKRYIAKV